ncbi:MAG: hypothetical protein ACLP8S_21265 [Solirubrobacteraceae bacterium]
MVVAGCGGSSHVSTADFAARALAICKQDLSQARQVALAGGEIVAMIARLDAGEAGSQHQLAALTPPASEKAAFVRFLADRRRVYASSKDPAALPTEQARLDAVEHTDAASAGIGACAQPILPAPYRPPASTPAKSRALIAALADRRHLSGAVIFVGHNPAALAVGPGGVWVANNDSTVTRIDPRTGKVGRPIPITGLPDAIAVGQGGVWVLSEGNNTVTRIDPRRETAVPTVVGDSPDAIADLGVVWVANWSSGTVTRLDPSNGNVVGTPIQVGNGPAAIAVDQNAVWVANEQDNTVSRIDPVTGLVFGRPIRVGQGPAALAIGHGLVWVENTLGNTLTRIDATTGTVVGRPIPLVANAGGIAVGLGAVWVLSGNGHTVTRLDPSTGRALGDPIPVGNDPSSISLGLGGAWIVSQDRVTRIQP